MSVRTVPDRQFQAGQRFTVSPLSLFSLGPAILGYAWGSSGYPASNRALLIPFVLPRAAVAYQLGWVNGASPSGNVDAGIYDAAGTLLISTGSTAKGSASTTQMVDVADTQLPGLELLYLAIAQDGVSALIQTNPHQRVLTALGMRQKATSFALPNPLTGTADVATAYVPMVFAELAVR